MLKRTLPPVVIAGLSLFSRALAAPPAALSSSPPAAPRPVDAQNTAFFEQNIRPLLVQRCYACHSTQSGVTQGGLRLDTRAGWTQGGTNGTVIVPGDPEKSRLVSAILGRPGIAAMPPGGRLSGKETALLTEWVKRGAPDPRDGSPNVSSSNSKTAAKTMSGTIDMAKGRAHWAFQPLKRVAAPPVKNAAWTRNPVDRFLLAKMEAQGLAPNPHADKRALIRRAYLDMIGLPPTPAQVDAFLNDKTPNAWEKVVDGLLASPHYGERWGRHWLDLARFAESHGYEQDYDRPNAYAYRDFVVRALNADMPYNRFVQWQLAGDEIAPDEPLALMATGFLGAGTHATQITKNQAEKERYDELDDMTATTGVAMLGLTVGCARCHNHKYDPISNQDYYRLVSTFTTTVRSDMDINLDAVGYGQAKARFDAEHAPIAEPLARYEREQLPPRMQTWIQSGGWKHLPAEWLLPKAISARPPDIARILAGLEAGQTTLNAADQAALLAWYKPLDPQWAALNEKVQAHLALAPRPNIQKAMICSEGVPAVRTHTQGADFLEQTYFLKRGDPNQKDGIATQSFLQVLMRAQEGEKHWQIAPPKGWRTSYRRRALANWITDTQDGAGALLARVIVNRVWQHHFGRGIVATPSDFGTQGARPTHPELLDWLAGELIRNNWQLKPIHRMLLCSAAYRQTVLPDAHKSKIDPDNRLVWRQNRQRMEAEVVRDSLLSVSGLLDERMYGPGTLDESMKRRSLYFTIKRSRLIPSLRLFDAPDSLQSIGARQTTTVAPQALMLLNNPNVREYALHLAQRVSQPSAQAATAAQTLNAVQPTAVQTSTAAPTPPALQNAPSQSIRAAYLLAVSRPPSAPELADALAFLAQQTASYQSKGQENANLLALADFCQVLMSTNEFVYVE